METIKVFFRTLIHPIQNMPTPDDAYVFVPTASQENQELTVLTPESTAHPTFSPTLLPPNIQLSPPPFEGEGMNNCGAATLSMLLSYYGWSGDQYVISDVIKPLDEDRNVNMEELVFYVEEYMPGLRVIYRPGGNLEVLKELLVAGFPIVVETSLELAQSFWVNDDLWAGHYLLITGYDDETGVFITQDSYLGANLAVPYADLMRNWKAFNYLYLVVYLPERESQIRAVMSESWNADAALERALQIASQETLTTPTDTYSWFNLGSNLVNAGCYDEAVAAFDQARTRGLPQRMLRYQFTPFKAYFYTYRMDDLLVLTEYALNVTPNSEEALLWRGWAFYRLGNRNEALTLMRRSLEAHPGFKEAEEAIQYIETH